MSEQKTVGSFPNPRTALYMKQVEEQILNPDPEALFPQIELPESFKKLMGDIFVKALINNEEFID